MERDDSLKDSRTLLLKPGHDSVLQVPDSLLHLQKDRPVQVQVFNPIDLSCCIKDSSELHVGKAVEAEVIENMQPEVEISPEYTSPAVVRHIAQSDTQVWKARLQEIVSKPQLLSPEQTKKLH